MSDLSRFFDPRRAIRQVKQAVATRRRDEGPEPSAVLAASANPWVRSLLERLHQRRSAILQQAGTDEAALTLGRVAEIEWLISTMEQETWQAKKRLGQPAPTP